MKVQKCSKDSSGKMSTGVLLNDVEEYQGLLSFVIFAACIQIR